MSGTLGGSDIGSIMGWNKRFSRIELFYQKIGLNQGTSDGFNEYTYWGSKNESNIMDTAQYFDFEDPHSYLDNAANGRKLRNISEFKYSVRNPAIPFINANVDGLIDLDRKRYKARRVAESKTISRQSAQMWSTIPPYHLGQVLVYLAVLKPMLHEEVAEIYYLEDGNKFYGWEIPQVPTLLEQIMEQCTIFNDKVQKGLEIVLNEFNLDARTKALQEIEPDPDDTEAYETFLSEAYKEKQAYFKIQGNEEIFNWAKEYMAVGEQIKELDSKRQLAKNHMMKFINDNSAQVVDFGDNGRITYNKRLYVNIEE
jgi:predicted phage-related endonuclease